MAATRVLLRLAAVLTLSALSGCIESPATQSPEDASQRQPTTDSGADGIEDAGQADSGAKPSYRLTREGMEVLVTEIYTSCEEAADCTLINNDCSCCGRTAVDAALTQIWYEQAQLACEDYRDPICDCAPRDYVAICEDGRCVAKLREEVDECYSPFSNTEHAYEPGAVGCPCSKRGQAICIDGAALHCEETDGFAAGARPSLAWFSVEDGVCYPQRDMSCGEGTAHADAASCLMAGSECYEMDDGRFCGF